jgi:hypothetical protein
MDSVAVDRRAIPAAACRKAFGQHADENLREFVVSAESTPTICRPSEFLPLPIAPSVGEFLEPTIVPDKIQPSAADARGAGANAANGVGDVVVGAGRMVDAVAAGAQDPPLQADDLGDEPIMQF